MTGPRDWFMSAETVDKTVQRWLRSAEAVDKIAQRFAHMQKCKFCGAMISQRDVFCDRCGKSQV